MGTIKTQGEYFNSVMDDIVCVCVCGSLCLQVEVCWACLQSNLVQMANGQSPRFPAILVVFLYHFVLYIPVIPTTKRLITCEIQMPFLRNEIKPNSCDPDLIFVFHLFSPPLCQIW